MRGLQADSSVYVRGERQIQEPNFVESHFESVDALSFWVHKRATSRNLRVVLSVVNAESLTVPIIKALQLNLSKFFNKPKADGSASINYTLGVSFSSNVKLSPSFNGELGNFFKVLKALNCAPLKLPFTTKAVRLSLVEEFVKLKCPLMKSEQNFVHKACVDWLVRWSLTHPNLSQAYDGTIPTEM